MLKLLSRKPVSTVMRGLKVFNRKGGRAQLSHRNTCLFNIFHIAIVVFQNSSYRNKPHEAGEGKYIPRERIFLTNLLSLFGLLRSETSRGTVSLPIWKPSLLPCANGFIYTSARHK